MLRSIRILIILSFLLILWPLQSFAQVGKTYNSQTGRKDICLKVGTEDGTVSNTRCKEIKVQDGYLSDETDYFLIKAGLANGGATSMTTADTAVSTSNTYIRKAIAAVSGFSAGTLANGDEGQTVTIFITENEGSLTYVLTPTTKTGFNDITFYGPDDQATLLYVNDTVGWIIFSESGVTIDY